MQAFRLNPRTGQSSQISPQKLSFLRKSQQQRRTLTMMCNTCKSILHQSTYSLDPNHPQIVPSFPLDPSKLTVKSFANVKIILTTDTVSLYCNCCEQYVGEILHQSKGFQENKGGIIYSVFQWKKKEKQTEKVQVEIGCYSGLKIQAIEQLISQLMYLKCKRYQSSMFNFRKMMRQYQNGFSNFIEVINLYRAEEDQLYNKRLSGSPSSKDQFGKSSRNKSPRTLSGSKCKSKAPSSSSGRFAGKDRQSIVSFRASGLVQTLNPIQELSD